MILLLSNDGDLSCDLVQGWLTNFSYPFLRINAFDLLRNRFDMRFTSSGEYHITLGDTDLPLHEINAIWFRKFGFFRSSDSYQQLLKADKLDDCALLFITKEFATVLNTFCDALNGKNWLTSPDKSNYNKIKVLMTAQKCGLQIPKIIVTNHKTSIADKEEDIISKSIFDSTIACWGVENRGMMYTTKVKNDDLKNLPSMFLPSMIQNLIKKKLEIRTFYLDGECYSMAIFSQNDNMTKLDFRCYNWDKPNRTVPYQLDEKTEDKIHALMQEIGLNCGSLDFIMDEDGELYFLEVNPTGQFGMVDFPCNYNLHRKVAEKLIQLDQAL